MTDYTIRPLGPDTWDAFARLAGKHNGVWGGCWCMWFHVLRTPGDWQLPGGGQFPDVPKEQSAARNRAVKEQLVRAGLAHAALVFDGGDAVAWCEYGTPAELPNIYHRREYEKGLDRLPDYRLTCFFVDRDYRRSGVAALALRGALELIAAAGGGVVEAYPHDTGGQKVSASFLYSATRTMFEQAGFCYDRPKGAKNCVMSITVRPAGQAGAAASAAGHSPAPSHSARA